MFKITGIIDNYVSHKQCFGEHGLSFYIETPDKTILFDTGQTENILHNIEKLNIALDNIEFVVLSHGHYDHTGGLKAILRKKSPLKVIAHPDIFVERYHIDPEKKDSVNISNPFSMQDLENAGAEFILTDKPYCFNDKTFTSGYIKRVSPYTSHKNMYLSSQGKMSPDSVNDDLVLIIIHDQSLNIICGCSHSGILNIVNHAIEITGISSINYIIGGLHFMNTDKNELNDILYD